MEITQTTVPGAGTLHDVTTRGGQRFRILVKHTGGREAFVYPPSDEDDWITVELDDDEADRIADILHSKPIPDRVAELERRVRMLEEP